MQYEKIDDPLQNDFGTLSQKTGLKLRYLFSKFDDFFKSCLEATVELKRPYVSLNWIFSTTVADECCLGFLSLCFLLSDTEMSLFSSKYAIYTQLWNLFKDDLVVKGGGGLV